MTIKAIIFDCDGTLVDSEHSHYLAWQHALQLHGGDLALDEYYQYVGNSIEKNAQLLAEKIGKYAYEDILTAKNAHYKTIQEKGLPPIESTINFLNRLAQSKAEFKVSLGVASAASKAEILTNLKNLEVEHLFDVVLSGKDDLNNYTDPEGTNKPKPYIYLEAAKLLGIYPYECVVIEDSLSGLIAGLDAGCITVAIPNSFTKRQDLSRAHLYLETFDGMTATKFIDLLLY